MIGSQRHSWRVPACTAMLAVKAACSEASEHSGPRRPRQLDEDRDVSVDGFLSSLYVNLILFASFLFLVSILRRFFPEFYQPRSYVPEDFGAIERRELPGKSKDQFGIEKGGPPRIPEKSVISWIKFVWNIPLETVLNDVGLDAYIFLRFAQRAAQLFGLVFTVLGCGIILPLNIAVGTNNETGFAHLSTANIASSQGVLWVHAISVWVFTLATFVVVLELDKEFVILRHRYLRFGVYHRTTDPARLDQRQKSGTANDAQGNGRELKQEDGQSGKSGFRFSSLTTWVEDNIRFRLPLRSLFSRKIPPLARDSLPSSATQPPHVAQPMLYSVMIEDLPSWISCDAQLYHYFDYFFPGKVYTASLIPHANKVDGLLDDRNSTVRLLERAERLRTDEDGNSDSSSEASVEKSLTSHEHSSTPAYGGTESDGTGQNKEASANASETKNNASEQTTDKDVRMVLFPEPWQACTDYMCCGPFYRTLCGGCYKKACKCCDDRGKHESEMLRELENEHPDIEDDTFFDNFRDDRPGVPKKCCYKGRRVKANAYLGKVLQVQTEELDSYRELAGHQHRRRASLPNYSQSRSDRILVEEGQSTDAKVKAGVTQAKNTLRKGIHFTSQAVAGPRKRRLNSEGFVPSSTGFVTFKSMQAVSEAILLGKRQLNLVLCDKVFELNKDFKKPQISSTEKPDEFSEERLSVRLAPGPEDVVWPHVTVKENARRTRRWVALAITFVIQFVYALFVAVIAGLVTIQNLENLLNVKSLVESNSFIRGFVAGFIPPLIIDYILSYLPPLLNWLSNKEYPPASSEIAMSTACKLYQFKAWQLMFVFTVSGTVLGSLNEIIHHPDQIVDSLGSSLPGLSSFYINLMMLWALYNAPWGMVRSYDLFWYYLYFRKRLLLPSVKLLEQIPGLKTFKKKGGSAGTYHTYHVWDMTKREFWEEVLQYNGGFSWASNFTNSLLAFLIGITYTSINPIIAPITAVYFVSAGFSWKYMLLYVNHKAWESGGMVWPHMARRVSVSLIVYQLTLIGMLGLKESHSSILIVPLLFITFMFDRYLQRKLEDYAKVLSPEEGRKVDEENADVEQQPEGREEEGQHSTFDSLKRLATSEISEEDRKLYTDSAYVRPSLLPKSNWKPDKIPTKKALYF